MQWTTNRKSYAVYQITPASVTLSDLEGYLSVWNLLTPIP